MRARLFKFEWQQCKLQAAVLCARGVSGGIKQQSRSATKEAAAGQLLTRKALMHAMHGQDWRAASRDRQVRESWSSRAAKGHCRRPPQTPSVRPAGLQGKKKRPAPTTRGASVGGGATLGEGTPPTRPHTTRKPLENPRLRTGLRKHTLNAPRPRSRRGPRPGPGSASALPIPTVRRPAHNI